MRFDRLVTPVTQQSEVDLLIARVDQLHPLASGNKYYKLKPHLDYAKAHKISSLLSFGGAYSNHLHALALSAQQAGFNSIGIIRGEAEYANNPTLSVAKNAGMELVFVNREEYRKRADKAYLSALQKRYPHSLIIPEGGSSDLAVAGCINLAHEINGSIPQTGIKKWDVMAVAAGTGATAAGLICGAPGGQGVQVYSALKDESLAERIKGFIEPCRQKNYQIHQADYGGFAKINRPLLEFIWKCHESSGVLFDPVYTSKLGMCLMAQIEAGFFAPGTRICMVHTGGLQGWLGMEQRVIKLMSVSYWQKLHAVLADTL